MKSRRIFLIRPRRRFGLAPIYLALLSLVSLSALGFVVASWPQAPELSADRPDRPDRQDRIEILPTGRPFDGVLTIPMDERKLQSRDKWT